MRERWRLPAAALAVGVAGALAVVASSHAAITITSLQAQARGTSITSGPMGSGYDIRIVATSRGTTWRSTSWTTGGVTRCVNHKPVRRPDGDSRTWTSSTSTRPTPRSKLLRARPGGTSPTRARSVPASTCSRRRPAAPRPSGSTSSRTTTAPGVRSRPSNLNLTTKVPATNNPLTAACQGMKVAVVLDESGSIGNAAPQVRKRDESSRPGSRRHRRQDGRLQVLDDGRHELHRPVQDDHPGVDRREQRRRSRLLPEPLPAGRDDELGRWAETGSQPNSGRQARPGRVPH